MKNEKKVRVVADISVDAREMLDEISEKTGVKKGFIIEEGIKNQCKRLIEAFGLDQ